MDASWRPANPNVPFFIEIGNFVVQVSATISNVLMFLLAASVGFVGTRIHHLSIRKATLLARSFSKRLRFLSFPILV